MDGLTYRYHTEAKSVTIGSVTVTWTALKSNKLYHVNEAVSSALYANDVDDMGSFNSSSVTTGNNYLFDEIGNLKKDNIEQIQEIKWNAYGKVESIIRTSGSTKPDLVFTYGADGQRLCKLTKPKDNSGNLKQELEWVYSYYVKDAQGNVMAIYNKTMATTGTANTYDEKLNVEEWSMYGQSRLGTHSGTEILVSQRRFTKFGTPSDGSWADRSYTAAASVSTLTGNINILTRGNKQFELSNHLGNVLVTVQDRKRSKDNNADNMADYYLPYLRTVTDYYAFGSPIYGRGGAIQKCSVVLVPRVITVKDSSTFENSSTEGFTAVGSGVTVATSVNVLRIGSTMAYRPKANRTVSLHKGETYTLKFDLLTMSNTGASHSVRVRIYLRGSTITNIYSSTGTKTINFTSDTTFGVTVEFNSVISSPNNNHYIEIDNFSISNDTTVWENTNLCGIDKDYRYRFNGEEHESAINGDLMVYDLGERFYDSRLGRMFSIDPLVQFYPFWSPYTYCGNNPVFIIDKNGMGIDPSSQAYIDGQKKKEKDKITELTDLMSIYQSQIDQNVQSGNEELNPYIESLIGKIKEKICQHEKNLSDISILENSTTTYSFTVNTALSGGETGPSGLNSISVILNSYESSIFIHELEHCIQFEKGSLSFIMWRRKFSGTIYGGGFLNDITDEINAYKRQYYSDPNSMPIPVNSVDDITSEYVRSIDNLKKGTEYRKLYDGPDLNLCTFADINYITFINLLSTENFYMLTSYNLQYIMDYDTKTYGYGFKLEINESGEIIFPPGSSGDGITPNFIMHIYKKE